LNAEEVHELQNKRVAGGLGDGSVKREIRIDAVVPVPDICGDRRQVIGDLREIGVAPSGSRVTRGIALKGQAQLEDLTAPTLASSAVCAIKSSTSW
jgi:hypothetical protein